MMAYRNNQPGCVGMGYVGEVCKGAAGRTALCEYFMDDLNAGQVP